jgi:hypothetical protein
VGVEGVEVELAQLKRRSDFRSKTGMRACGTGYTRDTDMGHGNGTGRRKEVMNYKDME